MIILEEKMPAPPPYSARTTAAPPPPFQGHRRQRLTLDTLPPHLLLRVVYSTFAITASIERQRKMLYWLTMSLRLVNRAFYVACMHVLRSTYLPAYSALVKPPHSTDPFPLAPPSAPRPSTTLSPIQSLQRETRVLDLFIALKVREDVWADESELHLERDESFRDLFDLMQPRARLEDLVRAYGARDGVVCVDTDDAAKPAAAGPSSSRTVLFSALAVTFSTRRLGLVLTTRERKKTIVEVQRARDEKLEVGAKNLVRELRAWLAGH